LLRRIGLHLLDGHVADHDLGEKLLLVVLAEEVQGQ
jgi:hypothetical protein